MQEQQPVDQRAAQHEFQHRHVDREQVRDHADAGSAARPASLAIRRQRTRLRVMRLTMASSTTAPRNDTSSPGETDVARVDGARADHAG